MLDAMAHDQTWSIYMNPLDHKVIVPVLVALAHSRLQPSDECRQGQGIAAEVPRVVAVTHVLISLDIQSSLVESSLTLPIISFTLYMYNSNLLSLSMHKCICMNP